MTYTTKEEIANLIRDHLSGTDRSVTKENMFHLISDITADSEFETVWSELREDGYLIQLVQLDRDTEKPLYKWDI